MQCTEVWGGGGWDGEQDLHLGVRPGLPALHRQLHMRSGTAGWTAPESSILGHHEPPRVPNHSVWKPPARAAWACEHTAGQAELPSGCCAPRSSQDLCHCTSCSHGEQQVSRCSPAHRASGAPNQPRSRFWVGCAPSWEVLRAHQDECQGGASEPKLIPPGAPQLCFLGWASQGAGSSSLAFSLCPPNHTLWA